jgi:alpha-mannosidase
VPLRLAARVVPGVRRVELALELVNGARDHRLRAAFRLPAPIAAVRADTPFGAVERPARAAARAWPEPPVSTHPMVSHVSGVGPWGRAGVAAAGLHEYEADGDTLYVTMLRCVGWLSRDDLASRAGDAGPMLATPEAQCPGPFAATYSWVVAGAAEPAGAFDRRAAEAVVPARAVALASWTGFERRARLALEQPAWQLSALHRAPGGGLVVRLFSTAPEPTQGRVRCHLPVARAHRTRLDGAPVAELPLAGGAFSLVLRPFEIVTLHLGPG